jgi:hypothetical protein
MGAMMTADDLRALRKRLGLTQAQLAEALDFRRARSAITKARGLPRCRSHAGDHKVRRDATEHALNVGRHCAVAAEQSMAAEHP